MKVLIACEESQTITKTFRNKGIEAYSCDLVDCSGGYPEWHIKDDVRNVIRYEDWDMMIAHPPCTYLSVSGARWFYHPDDSHLPTEERRPHPKFPNRKQKQQEAIDFVKGLYNADIEKVCIENPVGVLSTQWQKPDQIIQPYEFGEPHAKKTCLWLKNLPKLKPTEIVEPEYVEHKNGKRTPKWYFDALSLSPDERAKVRSKTFQGIATAMVAQWG